MIHKITTHALGVLRHTLELDIEFLRTFLLQYYQLQKSKIHWNHTMAVAWKRRDCFQGDNTPRDRIVLWFFKGRQLYEINRIKLSLLGIKCFGPSVYGRDGLLTLFVPVPIWPMGLKFHSEASLYKKNRVLEECCTFVIMPLTFFPRNKSTIRFCYYIRFGLCVLYFLDKIAKYNSISRKG